MGIQQTPGLGSKNSNKANWNQENFEALKETLNQFIPLIRFSEISRANFFDKVRPCKVIFPRHIYEEVAEFYYKKTLPKTLTLPPRSGKIKSKIFKPNLIKIIASWIERKNVNNHLLNIKCTSLNFFIVVAEMDSITIHCVISVCLVLSNDILQQTFMEGIIHLISYIVMDNIIVQVKALYFLLKMIMIQQI